MATGIQNKSHQETNLVSALPVKPMGGINPKFVLTAGAVAAVFFYTIGFVLRMLVTPLIFVSAAVILAHILVRPEKSQLIAKNLMKQTPEAIRSAIKNFPDALKKTYDISLRIYHASLQYVGNKILPPSKSPYTLNEVASGIGTTGVTLAKETYDTVRPKVVDCLESGLKFTENTFTEAQKYTTQTLIPTMNDRFNKTFPSL
jgi:hypothetical protein